MSDNVAIKDFSDAQATIATDELPGGVHAQYMKLMDGTDSSTNKLVIDAAGALSANVVQNGLVNAGNTRLTNLASSEVFVGTTMDVLEYSSVCVFVYSNAGASNGLEIQASADDITWFTVGTYSVAAGAATAFTSPTVARYMRVMFTNGASATTSFALQTILSKFAQTGVVTRPSDVMLDSMATEVNTVLAHYYNGSTGRWERGRGADGSLNVRFVDLQTGPTGLGSANAFVSRALGGGQSTAFVQISGTFVGTLNFEGTVDDTNWFGVNAIGIYTGAVVTSTTTTGIWSLSIAGLRSVRVRMSPWTSGTATVTLRVSQANGSVALSAPLPAGNNTIGRVNGADPIGATPAANPIRVGGVSRTSQPSSRANNQVSEFSLDKLGRVIAVIGHIREQIDTSTITVTSSTAAATLIAAQGAGVFTDISSLTLSNSSATGTTVTVSDGTHNFLYFVPASSTVSMPFTPAIPATTANVAWTVQCGTSVASVFANVVYAKNS